MAVARSSSGRVMKSQGEGAVFGGFFPTDNALYSIAYGTHTKTAEPIEMPFGTISGLDPGTMCYVGVTIPEGEWAISGENVPDFATKDRFGLNFPIYRKVGQNSISHY